MAYIFALKSNVGQKYATANKSTINNKYIDYTIQGLNLTGIPGMADWVTDLNPKQAVTGGMSEPLVLYNPGTGRFLGSTEQITQISGSNKSAVIAGTLSFVSFDNACKWYFKASTNANTFKIYFDDYKIKNKADLKQRLIYDANNSNRILISDEPIGNTVLLNDEWQIPGF